MKRVAVKVVETKDGIKRLEPHVGFEVQVDSDFDGKSMDDGFKKEFFNAIKQKLFECFYSSSEARGSDYTFNAVDPRTYSFSKQWHEDSSDSFTLGLTVTGKRNFIVQASVA